MTDDEGNSLGDDEKRELRKKAETYVKQINAKSSEADKMAEFDVVNDDYNAYLESLTTSAEGEESANTETTVTTVAESDDESAVTTTSDISEESDDTEESEDTDENTDEESQETTTSQDSQTDSTTTAVSSEDSDSETTTTTDPHANERIVQKQTTAAESDDETTETTTAESDSQRQEREFNEHLFEMSLGKAEVYDYSDEQIYVVIRGDLRERMTEDDLWSQDYIDSLVQSRFYDEFTDYMEDLAKNVEVNKNNRAYNRYAPFKLNLETQQA